MVELWLSRCFYCNVAPSFEKETYSNPFGNFNKPSYKHGLAQKLDICSTLKLKQLAFQQKVIA